MSDTELHTEKYIIGYIDLLGSKEKIRNDKNNHWLNVVNELYNNAWKRADELEKFYSHKKPFIKVFSDNILIAERVYTKDDDRFNSLSRLLYFLSYIQARALIDYKWLVRGSVVAGKLSVQEYEDDISQSFIWGEGLGNVQSIEEHIANDPRIIIDKTVFEVYSDLNLGYLLSHQRFAFDDVDSRTCLDYLSVYIDEEHSDEANKILNKASSVLRGMALRHNSDPNISKKISWTKNYLSRVASDFCCHLKSHGRLQVKGRSTVRTSKMWEAPATPQKHIIGYIELLGPSARISQDKDDKWLNAVNKLYNAAWNDAKRLAGYYPSEKLHIKIFSSNMLVAVKFLDKEKDRIDSMLFIFYFLTQLQSHALIDSQWMIQGGITIGDLYINDSPIVKNSGKDKHASNKDKGLSFVWGKGLLRAYELKEMYKDTAGILIDSDLYTSDSGIDMSCLDDYNTFTLEDENRCIYLNYFGVYRRANQMTSEFGEAKWRTIVHNLSQIEKEANGEEAIRKPIEWTRTYISYHQ